MRPRIAVLVFPLKNPNIGSGQMFLTELINVLEPLASKIYVITGNFFTSNIPRNTKIINVKAPIIKTSNEKVISRIIRFFKAQFEITKGLTLVLDKIDVAFLFLSSSLLFLPPILLRICGKGIGVIITGSGPQSISRMYPSLSGRFFSFIFSLIEHFNCMMADKIIVYSPTMITAMGLGRYKKKILTDGYRGFIDTKRFRVMRKIEERENIIGYIGRLSAEKGVLELARAIPLVTAKMSDVKFMFIGDGPLMDDIKKMLLENKCLDKVEFVGWVQNDIIPAYLNLMKLLVLPSYTEGLPKAVLEAMACGTPVLATTVGAIPDIIKDGETGFLLKNNSPDHIADRIIEILGDHINLGYVQRKARALVVEKYTYDKAVKRYNNILRSFQVSS